MKGIILLGSFGNVNKKQEYSTEQTQSENTHSVQH